MRDNRMNIGENPHQTICPKSRIKSSRETLEARLSGMDTGLLVAGRESTG